MGPLLLPAAVGLGALLASHRPRATSLPKLRGEDARGGHVRPSFGRLTIPEAQLLLQGVMLVDVQQLLDGVPPISQALFEGRLRYQRIDRREHWRSIREIWQYGGGDCEDLAAAVAAEQCVDSGQLPELVAAAHPILYQARPGLWHCVVQESGTRRLVDPSRTGGMGQP